MLRRRPRPCRKCAADIPHPFSHWHAWCRFCRRPRVFRGPCCRPCHLKAKLLVQDLIEELRRHP